MNRPGITAYSSSRDIFAANVRRLREQQGWTRSVLAAKCGCGPKVVTYVEDGKHAASLDTVDKIAAGLGVNAVALITRPDGDA